MDFNNILMLVGAAVFILPVSYMLGYARHEKQATDEHTAMCKRIEADRETDHHVIRELEISLLQAGEAIEAESNAFKSMKDQWAYSNGYRKALVQVMLDFGLWDFGKHSDDPAAMIKLLREHAATLAVDPQLNKAAKNLHTAGVRKGAKRGRLQMQKLMQKSINNQAATIVELDRALFESQGKRQLFKDAVITTLNDKVALPGVRKSIREAINVECERLRLAAIKKVA